MLNSLIESNRNSAIEPGLSNLLPKKCRKGIHQNAIEIFTARGSVPGSRAPGFISDDVSSVDIAGIHGKTTYLHPGQKKTPACCQAGVFGIFKN